MSHAGKFQNTRYTANADGINTLRILEAIRILRIVEKTKAYQASTPELYRLLRLFHNL
jgi:GDPmannose 4,6-dehydratase